VPPLLRVLVSAVPLLPHDRPLGLPTLARGARSFVLGGSGGSRSSAQSGGRARRRRRASETRRSAGRATLARRGASQAPLPPPSPDDVIFAVICAQATRAGQRRTARRCACGACGGHNTTVGQSMVSKTTRPDPVGGCHSRVMMTPVRARSRAREVRSYSDGRIAAHGRAARRRGATRRAPALRHEPACTSAAEHANTTMHSTTTTSSRNSIIRASAPAMGGAMLPRQGSFLMCL